MRRSSITVKTVSIAIALLLVQMVSLPDTAHAAWQRRELPDQSSDEEILVYVAGAALLVGGFFAYRKFVKQQGPRRPLQDPERGSIGYPARVLEGLDGLQGMEPKLEPGPTEHGEGPLKGQSDRLARLGKLVPSRVLIGWDPERNGPSVQVRWAF